MKKLYQCDVCLKCFKNEEECREHEKRHVKPEGIFSYGVSKFPTQAPGAEGACYPEEITIRFSNGKIGKFHLVKVFSD